MKEEKATTGTTGITNIDVNCKKTNLGSVVDKKQDASENKWSHLLCLLDNWKFSFVGNLGELEGETHHIQLKKEVKMQHIQPCSTPKVCKKKHTKLSAHTKWTFSKG